MERIMNEENDCNHVECPVDCTCREVVEHALD